MERPTPQFDRPLAGGLFAYIAKVIETLTALRTASVSDDLIVDCVEIHWYDAPVGHVFVSETDSYDFAFTKEFLTDFLGESYLGKAES